MGTLSAIKIRRLSEIGITEEWLQLTLSPFEKGYLIAKAQYEEYGTLDVPTNYQHKSGFWLGSWIDKIRKKRQELTDEQIQRLDDIGFVWGVSDSFEEWFCKAEQCYKTSGTLPLEPKQCKDQEELRICQWLRRQLIKRNKGQLTNEQIDRLSSIGMDWLTANERTWQRGYLHAKHYRETFGHLNVIVSFVCDDGYPLGEWLHTQRKQRNTLSAEKKQALAALGAHDMQ